MRAVVIGLAGVSLVVLAQPAVQQYTKRVQAHQTLSNCWSEDTQRGVTGMLQSEAVDEILAAVHRDAPGKKMSAEEIAPLVSAKATLIAGNSVNLDTGTVECEANFELTFSGASAEVHAPFGLYQSPVGLTPLIRTLPIRAAVRAAIEDIAAKKGYAKP